MDGTSKAGRGRRRESLAARQARVGIVANPRMTELPRPTPREVWTRWPDLRSSKRRSHMPDPSVQSGPDLAALDAYAQSLRQSDRAPAMAPEKTPDTDATERNTPSERSGVSRFWDCLPFGAAIKKPYRSNRGSNFAPATLPVTTHNPEFSSDPANTFGPVPENGQDYANTPSSPSGFRLFLARLAITSTVLFAVFYLWRVFWGIP